MDPVRSAMTEDRLLRFAQHVHSGLGKTEICRLMGISPSTYETWKDHEWVQKWLEELRMKQETRAIQMREMLQLEAHDLLRELISMSRDSQVSAATRAQIKQDLLDREGSLPRQAKVQPGSNEGKILMTDDQFDRFMRGIEESVTRRKPSLIEYDVTPKGGPAE